MRIVLVKTFALEGGEASFKGGFLCLEEVYLDEGSLGAEGSDLAGAVLFDVDDIGELVGHGAGQGDGGVGGGAIDPDVVGVPELRVVVLDDDGAGDEGAGGDLVKIRKAGAGEGGGVDAAFGARDFDFVDIGLFDDDAIGIAVRGTGVPVPYRGYGGDG